MATESIAAPCTKEELNKATEDLHQTFAVADLVGAIGGDASLDEVQMMDIGALVRRLLTKPFSVLCKLSDEMRDEAQVGGGS